MSACASIVKERQYQLGLAESIVVSLNSNIITTEGNTSDTYGLLLQEAQEIAQTHLDDQIAKGRAFTWEKATLGAAQPMFDLHGIITAYLFPLSSLQGPAGYIVVAKTKGAPKVVEFATSGYSPLEGGLQRAKAIIQSANITLIKNDPIYLGPLDYFYETTPTSQGERRFYSVGTSNLLVLPREVETDSLPLDSQLELSTEQAEVAAIQGYHRIDGVPEWQQFHDGLACLSGCVPTAVATIMGYWDVWYGDLIGENWHDAVLSIRNYMGTSCNGDTGWTTMDANTAVLYPRSKGYNFTAEHGPDPNMSVTIAELDADRPILLGFQPNSRWTQPHSVVGIGYNDQFLIVRDNWPGLPVEDRQVLSRPFWTIRFCPPGQNCSHHPPQLVCPQTGGVLLYQHPNYSCGNEEEGKGFVRMNQSGLVNNLGSFDNRASSIRVPAGWSVALYEHPNPGDGTYCVNAPGLSSFDGYVFNNGVNLDEAVSSFQVFTNENCAPSTPNNRTDNTPPSGYYTSPSSGSTVGRVVTLAANASDDQSGIAKVQFGGLWSGQWHVLGEDVDQPYEFTWDLCAAGVPDGEIQLGLRITDRAGNLFQIPSGQLPYIYKSYNCAPSSSWWLWSAQYWNDRNFGGSPVSAAIVGGPWPYLFFHWGDSSPSQGVNSDNWAARYTRTFYFPGDNYRFHCQHDDGCRVFVDGINWIDAWWPGYGGHDMTRYLAPGNHSVTVEFMDVSGDARLEIWWQGSGYLPHDVLPDNIGEYSHYWRAEYWVFTEFLDTTPQFTRLEGQTLDHNWGDGGPDPMLPTDNFRSKFTRLADFDCGNYRFVINADDGVRFTVDDQRWLDEWHDQVATFVIDRFMPRGTHSLRVDHYEHAGGSQISLSWVKLSDCSVSISPQYVSQMYVRPNEWFAPTIRLQVDSGYLDPLRSDILERVGGASFGSNQEYLRDTVESGQRYSFDANSPDPFWLNTLGYPEGTYNSAWQVRLGGGNLVGPVNTLQVVVDGTPPTLQFVSPSAHDTLAGSSVNVLVNAVDSLSGLEQVEFFAGYDDGTGWQWHKLGTDINGADGWSWAWQIENVPSQANVAIFAYGWDKSHNGQAAIVNDLAITRGSYWHVHLPVITNNHFGNGICLIESPHPYPNDYDNVWSLTNPDPRANSTRIHFSRFETESGYDYIYVRDVNNGQFDRFDGARSDVWSSPVPGRTVKVQLTSDGSVTGWGFCVDRIETVSEPLRPTLRIEPMSGTFGTRFNIYGSGFAPGELVQQWVITPSGQRFDDPTPETVNGEGNYSSWITIEYGPTGTYTLYARGNQSQQTVSTQFQIASSVAEGVETSRVSQITWGR